MNSSNLEAFSWSLPESLESIPLAELELPLVLRVILARRGFSDLGKASEYINPSPPPEPLDHFPQLGKAVRRLVDACNKKEKVAICGDYDADGMTSTALLTRVLNKMGAKVLPLIPSRLEEGYGLNTSMVENLHTERVSLIVTVDNGINAKEAIKAIQERSIDLIITDHHVMQIEPPEIFSLLHPSTTPTDSPYRDLAGVGLAYVLASQLTKENNSHIDNNDLLHLFCIGTIADMSKVNGVNRYFLSSGLRTFKSSNIPGIQSLIERSNIKSHRIYSEDISFKIAPRINSVGRIGEPKLIIDLLSNNDEEKVKLLAREVESINSKRRKLSDKIELEAFNMIEESPELGTGFIVLAQGDWHPGVIGIVASRIVEKYNRPTAILGGLNNNQLRGSLRSAVGISIIDALEVCSDLLVTHGGHKGAGGLTIEFDNISSLRSTLNKYFTSKFHEIDTSIKIKPEAFLSLEQIDQTLMSKMRLFEPFGVDNRKPLFWSRGCRVIDQKKLGDKHVKLMLQQNGRNVEAIFWKCPYQSKFPDYIDIVYSLTENSWKKYQSMLIELKTFRPSSEEVKITKGDRAYSCKKKDECVVITNEKGRSISFSIRDSLYNGLFNRTSGDRYTNSIARDAFSALGLTI